MRKGRNIIFLGIIGSFIFLSFPLVSSAQTEVTLHISEGWNIVSSPFEEPIKLSEIAKSCNLWTYQGKFWTWLYNLLMGWFRPDQIKKDEGVYVLSHQDCEVKLRGTPATFSSKKLKKGWNLFSTETSFDEIKSDCEIISSPPLWELIPGTDNWRHSSLDEKLNQSKGYWVKVKNDCTLSKEPEETAQLEITFDPSPAAYNDEGYWFWKIILSEHNGIGVKLTNFHRVCIGGSHSYDGSEIKKAWSRDYLPPWGTIYFSFWYSYVLPSMSYEIYTFTGIDDRGNEVTVQRKLSILRPEEKAAKVTLDFNPNPLKENGTWQAVLSENKGVGVQLKSLTKCSYDKDSKLVEIEKSNASLIEQYFSSTYLSPSGSLISQKKSRPSPEISYENLIITGEDDQGHLITISGKIYYGETAEAEIIFEPNPVPCKDGRWSWETTLKENNGVGIKIIGLAEEGPGDKGIGVWNVDTSSVEEWHGYSSAYLPPHGSLSWGDWSPYRPGGNYVKLIFTGIDDNGHKVTITGKVNFLSP